MQRRFQQMKKINWESGILNTTTPPKGLQNAVVHAIGKIFCFHGGQEHRALRLSHLQGDGDKYVYYENVFKNQNGSFKQQQGGPRVSLSRSTRKVPTSPA